MQENKGAIFILEDCEKALTDRRVFDSGSVGTILNITDGIVAESLNCKFICTFNCPLSEIDMALLRKGRLSLIYEFKKLSIEKTKALYGDADSEMIIADIYNINDDNGHKKHDDKKIGF
jgi:hypothetical protein